MNKRYAVFGVLALFVAPMGTGTLSAQPSPKALEKIAEMMTEADLNGDGKTTRAELNQHRGEMFGKLDRDGNGVIDKEDSPRIPVAKRKFDPAFEQVTSIYDRNDDGRVTRDEWNKSDPDVFALLDRNEDGAVSRSELPKPK